MNHNHSLMHPTLVVLMAVLLFAADRSLFGADAMASLEITEVEPPPEWAFWQRQLLDGLYPAAVEFVETYTREDGTLIWRDEWPGMDGSDDGYESFYNFPLYYVLGGPKAINDLADRLWDSVTRQFTEYGQVHNEFDAYYDWMHHGESYVYFYFFGLGDPLNPKIQARARRFAGLYLNEDPSAMNYDAEKKLIRSPINGSRGPRFVNSAEDWVTHRDVLAHYPLPFDDIPNVTESSAWIDDDRFPYILRTMNDRMMRGDVPLNLTATSLILNAYMYSDEAKYSDWITDYVRAWMGRVEDNNGILPDNVGLSGRVGENMGGKWWGGYYGWRWPHGLFNQIEATLIGAANATLLTGNKSYFDLHRSVIDLVAGRAKEETGRVLVPHRHGDDGWYDYRPLNPSYLVHLWYLTQETEDYDRLQRLTDDSSWSQLRYRKAKGDFGHEGYWLRYLEGKYPDYPTDMLKANYQETLRRLELARHDGSEIQERNVHHWQQRNPVVLEGLVQTMLGGPNHIYHGGLLHCRLRYFDFNEQRPGIPADVAALVETIAPDGLSVRLVNLHPTESRELVMQAGAFGEHEFTWVQGRKSRVSVNGRWVRVKLGPGAAERLEVGMDLYANHPSYETPWSSVVEP